MNLNGLNYPRIRLYTHFNKSTANISKNSKIYKLIFL